MDNDLNYIENELFNEDDHISNYSIKAKWGLGVNPSRLMEVSRFFNSAEELDDAGITVGSRTVLAYSPSGYEQLKAMGFSHKEIMKHYGEDNNTTSQ